MPYVPNQPHQTCDDCGARCQACSVNMEDRIPVYYLCERKVVRCERCATIALRKDLLATGKGSFYIGVRTVDSPGKPAKERWVGLSSKHPLQDGHVTQVSRWTNNWGAKVECYRFRVGDQWFSGTCYPDAHEIIRVKRIKSRATA